MDIQDLDVLAYEQTPIGGICLQQRGMEGDPTRRVTEITLDHQFLMSSHSTWSERKLAERGLELCAGEGLRVLVGGLGLGYTAREVLRSSRVGKLEVVELLAPVIGWLERGLLPLAKDLRGDPRLEVVNGDVFGRLSGEASAEFDLLLIDVDHSPEERLGETSESFYEEAGLRKMALHLAPGGIFGFWSYAESPRFEAGLRNVFPEVWAEPLTFHNEVIQDDETNWLYFAKKPTS
ncbi:MAG: spermidine synthase [Deltaproteobacteria bacterium]|nr:spermidine synthase [Deltaproteobacteria bacterium]